MFVLFEDGGKFLAGRVLSRADASAQVELDSGKRVKLKSAALLLEFDAPAPQQLLAEAQALAGQIDLDLAWEFAPEEEFGFADLAREYFSAQASVAQQAAALMRLFEAPHYFRRSGKGRFRKASAEVVRQAVAAIERRRQQQQQIAQWAQELGAGQCPAPIREQLYRILFKPDKNGPEYKAVVEASRATHLAPLALLQRAGAIDSAYQFHWRRFLLEHFPRGTRFPAVSVPPLREELPVAAVRAFSIDDSSTTEIDDALSLQGLGSGTVTLGIHIAAPGLAIAPDSEVDRIARDRLSTVYMPGHKLTMLPDEVVQGYTLRGGEDCPAVSLYLRIDENSLQVHDSHTRLERVPIVANLRHDVIDTWVTQEWLEGGAPAAADPPADAFGALTDAKASLGWLWRLARHLKAQREVVRGKPENFNRPDYSFKLAGVGDEPGGDETVSITVRQRGAPLDLIVAEAMILANSTWGAWLADLGVPAIYRSQASLAPGVKVRMGTRALPHAGIGVRCYAWSTSPLRRYTDLVNQWQIIAAARHGNTAALAAPFKPRDSALLAVISAFDAAYTAYNDFQAGIERFWTLRHLQQRALTQLEVTVVRDGASTVVARADTLPLVLMVHGAGDARRGERLRVRLGEIDLVALDVSATCVERLAPGPGEAAAGTDLADAAADAEGDEPVAGPISIAVDLNEAPADGDNPSP